MKMMMMNRDDDGEDQKEKENYMTDPLHTASLENFDDLVEDVNRQATHKQGNKRSSERQSRKTENSIGEDSKCKYWNTHVQEGGAENG